MSVNTAKHRTASLTLAIAFLLAFSAPAAERAVQRDAFVPKSVARTVSRAVAQSSPDPLGSAREVWIAPRTDGLPGDGTPANPFNGSGEHFDARMRDFSVTNAVTNFSIHLLPGTYDTRGSGVWYPLTGWRIRGAGIDLTTLKLVNVTSYVYAVIAPFYLIRSDNIEVADLTVDCNYSTGNSNVASAVILSGSDNVIRRVKAIHAYGIFPIHENFTLGIVCGASPVSRGNLIEECIVSDFRGNYGTVISLDSADGAYAAKVHQHGVLRRNRVYDLHTGTGPSYGQAFQVAGAIDTLVEDNVAVRCDSGFYTDTGPCRNLILRGNRFLECKQAGISLAGRSLENVVVENNFIEMEAGSRSYGIAVNDGGGINRLTQFKIRNNLLRSVGNRLSQTGGLGLDLDDAGTFLITGNRIDSSLRSFSRASRVGLFFDNTDADGVPLFLPEAAKVNQVSLPRGDAGTLLLNQGPAHVIVEVSSEPAANGTNLLVAYRRAKAMTPHGQPLSATNRATVFLFPSRYLLPDAALVLDTPCVDLVGLGNAQATRLESDGDTLVQWAGDVILQNLTLHCSASLPPTFTSQDKAAYAPADNLPGTVVRNCHFTASNRGWGMRLGITYAGLYENSVCGPRGWGGPGNFTGRASHCQAGDDSFGAGGVFTGGVTNCTAGARSFGGGGAGGFHGLARNCTAGHGSFGGSGTLTGCEVSGGVNPAVLTTGRLTDCRIGPAPGDEPALLVGPGAVLYNCTVLANPAGSGFSIDAPSPTPARVAHCRLNHGMHNVVNTVAQPFNVEDPSLE